MASYLITSVIYRLDGQVVIKGISTWNKRRETFRVAETALNIPVLVGRLYSINRMNGAILFSPSPMSYTHWSALVKNNFFIPCLNLSQRAKAKLLQLTKEDISPILQVLEHDPSSASFVIPELHAAYIFYYFQSQPQAIEALAFLMKAGLRQSEALSICSTHSPSDAVSLLETDAQVVPYLRPPESYPEGSIAEGLARSACAGLIHWMQSKALRGDTLLSIGDIPVELEPALSKSIEHNMVVSTPEHCQLLGQHLIQSSIRSELQRLSNDFFPTYSDREIDFAFVRFSNMYGVLDGSDHHSQVVTAINARISIVSHSSSLTASAFCDELSSILQTLGAAEPTVLYQSSYGHAVTEAQTAHWESINTEGRFRTFFVWDFQWYSAVDLSLLLQRFNSTDRIVFLHNESTAISDSLNSLITKQLQSYYPSDTLKNDVHDLCHERPNGEGLDAAVAALNADPNLVAICDSLQLAMQINYRVRRNRAATALITSTDTYFKGDRILLKEATPKKVTYTRIISTDDRGLMVETQGKRWRLDEEAVRGSVCSLGAAVTLNDAIHAQVRRAVLVAATSKVSSIRVAMANLGIETAGTYECVQSMQTPSLSMQQITPTVE
ncbi:hypothetical protein ACU7AI_17175 [Pseudomonas aeruginosa]|uniref:hypothetical protein n=1 Tax=Pseudomonas TaxID=286 RepID=UPI000A446DAD|nr:MULTISPECIES: hypothetical protein [Pseudomonas]MDD2039304.1 hypothetical protein [Pseudomonas putida]MDD2044923.1 hypothetical protein [Pseudomonas putida]